MQGHRARGRQPVQVQSADEARTRVREAQLQLEQLLALGIDGWGAARAAEAVHAALNARDLAVLEQPRQGDAG